MALVPTTFNGLTRLLTGAESFRTNRTPSIVWAQGNSSHASCSLPNAPLRLSAHASIWTYAPKWGQPPKLLNKLSHNPKALQNPTTGVSQTLKSSGKPKSRGNKPNPKGDTEGSKRLQIDACWHKQALCLPQPCLLIEINSKALESPQILSPAEEP